MNRHITKWVWAHVTRKRLIIPFTYEFVWNVQTEMWVVAWHREVMQAIRGESHE